MTRDPYKLRACPLCGREARPHKTTGRFPKHYAHVSGVRRLCLHSGTVALTTEELGWPKSAYKCGAGRGSDTTGAGARNTRPTNNEARS